MKTKDFVTGVAVGLLIGIFLTWLFAHAYTFHASGDRAWRFNTFTGTTWVLGSGKTRDSYGCWYKIEEP